MNETRVSDNSPRRLEKRLGSMTESLFFLPFFFAIIAASSFAKSAAHFLDLMFFLFSLALLALSIFRFRLVYSKLPNLSRGLIILGYLIFSSCAMISYYHHDSSLSFFDWGFIVFVAGAFLFILLDVFYFEKRFSPQRSRDEKPKQPAAASQIKEPPPLYTRKELVEQSGILFVGILLIGIAWTAKYGGIPIYFQIVAVALSMFQFTLSYARLEVWLRAMMAFIYSFFLVFPFLPFDRWEMASNQDYMAFFASIMIFQQCQNAFSERL